MAENMKLRTVYLPVSVIARMDALCRELQGGGKCTRGDMIRAAICQMYFPDLLEDVPQTLEPFMKKGVREEKMSISVELVLEENGRMIPAVYYRKAGSSQNYVIAKDGQRYGFKVKNNTNSRVEFVTSVDGLDTLDGKDASREKRGLVVSAYDSYTFEGFRLNNENVATFRFGGVESSYAGAMGKPRNVGVIGVCAYKEKAKISFDGPKKYSYALNMDPDIREQYTSGELSYGSKAIQSNADFLSDGRGLEIKGKVNQLGTMFGEQRSNEVGSTSFTRASEKPFFETAIRYDTRENLIQLGVLVGDEVLDQRESANPFPEDTGFCKPPEGWTG
jgi:hypothetical protein